MSRFLLTQDAEADLHGIDAYLDSIPKSSATRVAKEIAEALLTIGDFPFIGLAHSHLTLLLGREVRSRLVHPYRIYYTFAGRTPEILAILHGARDHATVLSTRLT
jgi:plasmid stabilization system protein ParE